MDMRINAGYVITSSVHIGESEFVLGVSMKAPSQFVTWKCTGGTNYYWGHYFNDEFAAEKDLVARAQEEIQYLEERNSQVEQAQAEKDFQTRPTGHSGRAKTGKERER